MKDKTYADMFVDFLLSRDKQQKEAILQDIYELESKKEDGISQEEIRLLLGSTLPAEELLDKLDSMPKRRRN